MTNEAPRATLVNVAMKVNELVDFAERLGKLGKEAADSQTDIGVKFYDSAKRKLVTLGDAKLVYLAYAKGANVDTSNAKSLKSQVSKLGAFHKLATKPASVNGLQFIKDVREVCDEGRKPGAAPTSSYEKVLKAIREQNKTEHQQNLSKDAIRALFAKKAAAPPEVTEALEAIIEKCDKYIDLLPTDGARFKAIADEARAQIEAIRKDAADLADHERIEAGMTTQEEEYSDESSDEVSEEVSEEEMAEAAMPEVWGNEIAEAA